MIFCPKQYVLQPKLDCQEWIIHRADQRLSAPIPHITDCIAVQSPGTIHDYYSNGDYWWPNPGTPDGLPYVCRDGESNPGNFNHHRMLLRGMRTNVAYLTSSYCATDDPQYSDHALKTLKEFFLEPETRMSPHLSYAQAIPGVCDGRGIGIIDTLHLIDVPIAAWHLYDKGRMPERMYLALRDWFAAYLHWMLTSEHGISEMNAKNNHSICFFVQATVFAMFTDREDVMEFCREKYKHFLLPQMAADGSFPLELARTKPYSYSIFALDNMVTLCHLLSTKEDNLWDYETPDGAGIQKGIQFLLPYLFKKSLWPYQKDIAHFDAFPARASSMLFAGCTLGCQELLTLFYTLPPVPEDEEARRNLSIRIPFLWM